MSRLTRGLERWRGRWVFRLVLFWGGIGLALPPVAPPELTSDAALLAALQRGAFDFFWLEANPTNGLIRDRTQTHSKCSIAAVGFGLSALPIGVAHGWVTRTAAAQRVALTLRTFAQGRQAVGETGVIGYRGWYYHFLEMDTAQRAWKCELSSIDTALFLAGALDAAAYFDQPRDPVETEIRATTDRLIRRVDWRWMCDGGDTLTMGWHPERGFLASRWRGYNEAMILYLLALGAPEHPLPPSSWQAWTKTYRWQTNYGIAHVPFPHLFAHQYSHCWVDFRGIADAPMRKHRLDYFENSRRATLAQQTYAIANPLGHPGYSARVWGFTASDGPAGYSAHGAPPPDHEDGTIAPTAAGGSLPFAPEICRPTLREFHTRWGRELWTKYGFRDAFNLRADWYATDVLGIDQGPILLMIENHLSGSVWRRMQSSPVLQRGLRAAGFRRYRAGGNFESSAEPPTGHLNQSPKTARTPGGPP